MDSGKKADREALLRDLLNNSNPAVTARIDEFLTELSEEAEDLVSRNHVAESLAELLSRDPSEEEVQKFFSLNHSIFGLPGPIYRGIKIVHGVLPKFHLTPERIPDYTLASFPLTRTQFPSGLSFIEIKKPSAPIFSQHNRLSRDLNDAWIECVDTLRLVGLNYLDTLRRITAKIDANLEKEAEAYFENMKGLDIRHFGMPRCKAVIVIGRRSSLDSEDLLRLQHLGLSTGWAISVLTYDSVLDSLQNYDDNYGPWHWAW